MALYLLQASELMKLPLGEVLGREIKFKGRYTGRWRRGEVAGVKTIAKGRIVLQVLYGRRTDTATNVFLEEVLWRDDA